MPKRIFLYAPKDELSGNQISVEYNPDIGYTISINGFDGLAMELTKDQIFESAKMLIDFALEEQDIC
jgi:hypothetical protein